MRITMAAIAALAATTATMAMAQQPQRIARPDRAGVVRALSPHDEWNGDWRRDRSPTDQHGPGPGARDGARPGRGGPGMGMGIMRDPAKLFAVIDADRNGSISRPEFDRFHAQARSRVEERMRDRRGADGRPPRR